MKGSPSAATFSLARLLPFPQTTFELHISRLTCQQRSLQPHLTLRGLTTGQHDVSTDTAAVHATMYKLPPPYHHNDYQLTSCVSNLGPFFHLPTSPQVLITISNRNILSHTNTSRSHNKRLGRRSRFHPRRPAS